MALTAAEKKEMEALEREVGAPKRAGGLSPEEYAEMQDLEKEVGATEKSWLDTELPFGTSPRGLIKGGLNALPAAGAIAGGLMGGTAGSVVPVYGTAAGGVAGAGLGMGMGTALKNAGEGLLGEKKTREQIWTEPAKAIPEGAMYEMGGQALGAGLKMAADSKAGQVIKKGAGKVASKIGSTLTGVSEKEIQTYAKKADEINAMSKASGGDVQEAADSMRGEFGEKIRQFREGVNSKISEALKNRANEAIEVQPILDALAGQQQKINPKLNPEALAQVDDVIKRINSLAKDGKIGLSDAHEVKNYLQDIASPAYNSGPVFPGGKVVQRGAKSAAAVARQAINKAAPEIASANNSLAKLHKIEDSMNRNMLKEGKTSASLMAAGSGGNAQNAKALKDLGEATGSDMLGGAEKLAAMRTFGNPSLMPADTTGKAVGRMLLGGAIGTGVGGPIGGAIGGALTSPATLKAAINTGRAVGAGAEGLLVNNPQLAGQALLPFLSKKKKTGLLKDRDGLMIPITEGYEQ